MAFVSALPVRSGAAASLLPTSVAPRFPAPSFQTSAARRSRLPPRMAGGPTRTTECDTLAKKFLDGLKGLGKTRIVVTNSAGVLETLTSWDGLFFATIPKGEYANLIKPAENLDMHLRIGAVAGARFETGVSRTASKATTYIIRFLGEDKEEVVMTVFLQWDKEPEDIAQDRIDCWMKLKEDYATDGDNAWF